MFSRLTTLTCIGSFIFDCEFVRGDDDDDCGVSVDYVDNSGQFKLESDCTSEFLKFKMDSLIEVDSSGDSTSNKISSFASQDYEWETNEDGEFQGVSAIVNTYSSDLSSGQSSFGEFNFTTILFLSNGTITLDDGDEVDVNSQSLKWTIEVDDWPFLSSNNSLEICMSVVHGGDGDSDSDSTDSTDDTDSTDSTDSTDDTDSTDNSSTDDSSMDSNETESSGTRRRSLLSTSSTFGDFNVIVPLSVELDGEVVEGVSFDYEEISSNGSDTSLSFCWTFDYFDYSLVYDPVAQYDETSSTTNSNGDDDDDEDGAKQNSIVISAIFSLVFMYLAK